MAKKTAKSKLIKAKGTLVLSTYEQITGLSTVKTLTAPSGTRYAMIQAEAQNIRWRGDGTNPTATVGMLLKPADAPLLLEIFPLANLKFIEAAIGGILNVHYFKRKI